MPSGPTTSTIAAQLPVAGLTIAVGTAGSPETLDVVANVSDYSQAMKSTVVMTTNVGDSNVRRAPTIIDPGEPTFKIFWIPLEPSHRNSASSGSVAAGLRYLMLQKLLRDWEISYPADANGSASADAFKSFVTEFGITGKTAGVFEASIKLGINDQNPSFV
jgi:hypothetical protein